MYKKGSGILLPISALPSKYGIGAFGKAAYNFIDFLYKSGQQYWQILPLGPVSYGDSPYQPFSIYAGNPYYIDLELLIQNGLISEQDCSSVDFDCSDEIDYEKQFNDRFIILKKAYNNSNGKFDSEIVEFKSENKNWIIEYALYMALKYENNNLSWQQWDDTIRKREKAAVENALVRHEDEIQFWIFVQYLFFDQYYNLKSYANRRGISIIGDIPIYAAEDSADVWADSKVFMLNENKVPILVSGVPPDAFSQEGQLWGNPVYNWDYLKSTSYEWWIKRIIFSLKMYDIVRIDHFRGFDEFWAVPYGSVNAINGTWLKANGKDMFDALKLQLGDLKIIAEDLGIITESVNNLRKQTGFPGMKVLQFAFDRNVNNPYLPQNYEENSVAYTGTHDNDTLKGWFDGLDDSEKRYVAESLNINLDKTENIYYDIIKKLYDSKANICIIPLQDFLGISSEGRINTPSTLGINWTFRVNNDMLTDELIKKIRNMSENSNRLL